MIKKMVSSRRVPSNTTRTIEHASVNNQHGLSKVEIKNSSSKRVRRNSKD
jgi:hypothetical protein